MTYYSYKDYKTYEFTAFAATDLGLGSSANTGESFTMPGSATLCITVRDDDSKLSGDDRYNESANDYYGQTASITGASGGERGNGGQIYAESYFWVSDQHGNWYVMIEIEQEHSDDDYLAFYTGGGYSVPPAGAQLTVGSKCNVAGDWIDFNCLDSGSKAEPLGSLGGRLFIDSDHDNTEVNAAGGWEAGFDGATVRLLDADGNVVATTTTDHYGTYKFEGIAAGDYTVHFEEPGGFDFVTQNVGHDGADSDVNQTSGKTASVHVGAGQNVWNVDAGIKETPDASIKGRLFVDSNHDNTELDASHGLEAGFGGATVTLLDAHGNVIATTTTDADGSYSFEGLSAGNYVVHVEEPDGYGFVKMDQGDYRYDSDVNQHTGKTTEICLTNDRDVCDIDIGIKQQTGAISGTVFCDTDCDGKSAEITTVPGMTYTVEAEDMNLCNFDVVHGAQASGGELVKLKTTHYSNDGYLQTHFQGKDGTYDIKLAVQDENDGQSTIYVKVNGHLVKAVKLNRDSDGSGDDNGGFSTFVVQDVDLSKGDDIKLIVDGNCAEWVRIDKLDFVGADTVTTTAEPVKSGVTVNLLNAAGDIVATTVTDAEGTYHFNNIPVGDYTIQGIAPDGTEFTIQDVAGNTHDDIDSDVNADGLSGTISVTANSNTDIDLGVCEVKLGSLSGRYFADTDRDGLDNDGAANGIAGITVMLLDAAGTPTGATTTTDANGEYSFGDLEAGTYGVKFTDPATDRELTAQNVDGDVSDDIDSDAGDIGGGMSQILGITVVAGADTPDNDAGVVELLGALSGTYFCDDNRDGVDDGAAGGDADIAGKTVTLFDAAGNAVATTTTDAEGNYRFEGLAAGDYSVGFEATEGKEFIAPNVGDDADDSDVTDPATGRTDPVAVVAGEETTDVDAGVQSLLGGLSGRYFCDDNEDGLDNDGADNGIAGVQVQLLDASGAPITGRTTTTDAQGNYVFTGLLAGVYGVLFTDAVSGKELTVQNVDGDVSDDIDSDAADLGGGQSQILGITVVAGADTPDNDAGVIVPNEAPDAVDDAGKGCADEFIFIDLLANDSDPDGGTIGVTQISDADETVGVGGTLTLADGALVTLNADGTVTVDGTAAYADLLIGAEATDSFSYTLTDNEGATDTANVDVTFCGAKNTLETIDASLDGATVTYVVGNIATFAGLINGYTLDLQSSSSADIPLGSYTAAYCIDGTSPFDLGVLTTADVSVATEANAIAAGVVNADKIDSVNWLLNNDFTTVDNGDGTGDTYTDLEVQEAIWTLLNGETFFINEPAFPFPAVTDNENGVRDGVEIATLENIAEIAMAAMASGDGFVAGAGDIVGLILDPTDPTSQEQPFIIGVDFDTLAQDCICI